ncbi:hypothetical protein BDW68DRAFT_84314 [Aspergillus falconensis]
MTTLLSLPTELLLSIFDLLAAPSKHTFSLSCHYLNHTFGPLCPALATNETYALRAALARDGLSFANHAYCVGCHTVHRHKYFTTNQLSLSPLIRKCTATQKHLYVEPGKFLSYQDAFSREFWFPRPYPNNNEPPQLDTGSIIRFGREYIRKFQESAACSSYELLTLPDINIDMDSKVMGSGFGFDFTVSKTQIARILRGFDIPVCPHTRLGDDLVVKSYRESVSKSTAGNSVSSSEGRRREYQCKLGQGQVDNFTIGDILSMWQKDKADACCKFPGCKTVFRWECRSGLKKDGWKTILIHVKRHLGYLLTPMDPHWMAQLVTVPDEDRLGKYWTECFEWRNANLAIEEKRYERVLLARTRSGKMELRRAEEVEFELLRRENDYLRHPHREKRRLISVLEELGDGEKKASRATLLCLEATQRLQEEEAEKDLYRPLHSAEIILESLEKDDFKKMFERMRGLGFYGGTWMRNLFRPA